MKPVRQSKTQGDDTAKECCGKGKSIFITIALYWLIRIIFGGRTQFPTNAVDCAVFLVISQHCHVAVLTTITPECHVLRQLPQASVRQLAHRAGGYGPVFGPVLCGRKHVQSALEAQLQEGLQRRGQQNISGRSNFLSLLCLKTREALPEPGGRLEGWVSQGQPHHSSGTELLVKVDHWKAQNDALTCYLSSCTTEGTLLICATETICRRIKCNSNQ